jgi:transposase-like protein
MRRSTDRADDGLVLPPPADPAGDARRELAERLVAQARASGVDLVGRDGLLADITRRVLETGLEVEMSEHLGYDRHAQEGRDRGNSRNGARAKTVLIEVGPVEIAVPRDRDGTFEPATVRKRQRRLQDGDAMVISLCAKGLTTGEIQAHLAEVYSADISRETISKITDAVLEEMTGWLARPLDRVYPVVFIDAIHVKVRDGQVANRAFCTAIGVTVDGKRDILGIWVGPAGRAPSSGWGCSPSCATAASPMSASRPATASTGLPDAITATWAVAVIQTCSAHMRVALVSTGAPEARTV